MGSVNDLRHGALCYPDLYHRYVEMERKIGHTIFMRGKEPISLEDPVGSWRLVRIKDDKIDIMGPLYLIFH